MNILFDRLPDSVYIQGNKYMVRSDFRTMLLIDELLSDKDANDKEKTQIAINIFYIDVPNDTQEASKQLQLFQNCNGIFDSKNDYQTKKQQQRNYDVMSFKYDQASIFSGFYRTYNIDLSTAKLHWFVFKALLMDLDSDCGFMQDLKYRCTDLASIKDSELRAFYKRMQYEHALPLDKDEQTDINKINKALMTHGDLSNI